MKLFPFFSHLFFTGLIFISSGSSLCAAQDRALEETASRKNFSDLVWRKQPVTPEETNQKIEQAAQQAKDKDSISFATFYNIAYPENNSEYEALNGYALLLVTGISKRQEDLPLKSVYVQQGTDRIELKLIRMFLSDQSGSSNSSAKVFGPYRMDAVYVLPISLRTKAGTLLADYAQNHSGVKLSVFGSPLPNKVAEIAAHLPKNQTEPEYRKN